MEHSFNTDVAKEYGVHCAIILNHIAYWTHYNRANGTNYHDGDYWTYNSTKAFSKLFPYLSARQISVTLQKLKDYGLIKTGNYNKSAYDRTLWYALTEKGESILQNGEMDERRMSNGFSENVTPIPDINSIENSGINSNQDNRSSEDDHISEKKSESKTKIEQEFDSLWNEYPRKEGKKKALAAYERARKHGTTFEQVKNGIEAYKDKIKRQKIESQYIKQGSTWFNGECWNDDYSDSIPRVVVRKWSRDDSRKNPDALPF